MSDFYLILKNLTRNKLRLCLNGFALLIAFLLFGLLGSLKAAFNSGIELSADDRLVVVNKINFTQPLPIAYINKIKSLENVKNVTHANWFGGYYQDPKVFMTTFAVDPESYLEVFPEIVLSEEEKKSWFATRNGMVVGSTLAAQHGWKIGDTVPISSNIFSHKEGGQTWQFVVSGIFQPGDAKTDTNSLLFHYEYYNETQSFGGDFIGWATIVTADPKLNESVMSAVDELFANSPFETETSTEQQFAKAFLEQIGDIGMIVTSVLAAAFFTILLIVGNSMALTVNERTGEIAVLKTLGFQATRIFKMVLSESILLSLFGALAGTLLAAFILTGLAEQPAISQSIPNLALADDIVVSALIYALLLGLVTGIVPAYRAMKLNTIDALNRN